MPTDEHSFPKDWGTGLQDTVDWADAGAFANLIDHPNIRGYVVEGYEFDMNWSNNILNVGSGRAYVHISETKTNDHQGDGGPDEKTLLGGSFVAQRGASGDINLVSDAVNYIWLRADRQDNDVVAISSNTDAVAPTPPSLLIGRVDTGEEVLYEDNRAPSVKAQRIVVTGDTHGAEY